MTACFTQLNDELAEVERQIIAVRLKCEEKLEVENERCAQVERRREELVQEHEKTLADAVAEYEEQIRGVQERAEEQVGRARQEKQEAMERARVATEKAESDEQRIRDLETELYELRRVFDTVLHNEEAESRDVRNRADHHVHQRLENTNQYIRDMSRYASEIQNGVVHSIEAMHDEQKVSLEVAQSSADERSRFKDLCTASLSHEKRDMTHEEFQGVRTELVQGWYDDWVSIAHSGQPELWTDKIRWEGSAEEPLKPADKFSARPVEHARQLVTERQQLAQDGASRLVAWK